MKNKTEPRVHILRSLVDYTDFSVNGVDFTKCWGAAEIGNTVVCWEGTATGSVRFFYSNRSAVRHEFVKRYNGNGNRLYRMSTVRPSYTREYMPSLVNFILYFVKSRKPNMQTAFRTLRQNPG